MRLGWRWGRRGRRPLDQSLWRRGQLAVWVVVVVVVVVRRSDVMLMLMLIIRRKMMRVVMMVPVVVEMVMVAREGMVCR